jgi:glycosyltransferase involved in cell wall biosynthesis
MTGDAQPAVVDVIIPVHNRSQLIRACLESVRAQSLEPDSVIVVDDGSTDETPTVLAEYARRWGRLRVIRSEHRGAAHARNLGLAAARAQFVAFLDSDDIWDPSKLERQIALFAGRPELGVVHCACFQIGETGERLAGAPVFAPSKRGWIFEHMINTLYHLAGSASGVVARRDLVMSVGGFDESLFHVEDQDLWLKLARVSTVDYVPEALVGLRNHSGSRFAARLKSDPAFALLQHVTVWSKWIHVADEAAILRAFRRKVFFLNRTSLFRLVSHYRAYRTFKTSDVALARRLFQDFRFYLRCMIAADTVAGTLHQRTSFPFAAKLILPHSLRLQFEQAVGKFRKSRTKETNGGAGAPAETSIRVLDATIAAYAASIGLEKFLLVGSHSAEYEAQSEAERGFYQETGRPALILTEKKSRPRIKAPFHRFGHVICTQPQFLYGSYWCMDLMAAGYFYAHFLTQRGPRRVALPAQLMRNLLARVGLPTAFSAALAPRHFSQRRPRRYQPVSGRILMLSAEFLQGGAERRMFNTAAGLVRRGYDVRMIAFDKSPPEAPTFAQEFDRLGIAAETLPALTEEPCAADFAVLNTGIILEKCRDFPDGLPTWSAAWPTRLRAIGPRWCTAGWTSRALFQRSLRLSSAFPAS